MIKKIIGSYIFGFVLLLLSYSTVYGLSGISEDFERDIPRVTSSNPSALGGYFEAVSGLGAGDWAEGETDGVTGNRFLRMHTASSSENSLYRYYGTWNGRVVFESCIVEMKICPGDYRLDRDVSIKLNNLWMSGQSSNGIRFGRDGHIYSFDTDVGEYEAGKWYHIALVFYNGLKKFDLFIDGNLVINHKISNQGNLNLESGLHSLGEIRIKQIGIRGQSGDFYLDDFKIWESNIGYYGDTVISSSEYEINDTEEIICGVAIGTTVEVFKNNVGLPAYATLKLYQSDHVTEVIEGEIQKDMYASVISPDYYTVKEYRIQFPIFADEEGKSLIRLKDGGIMNIKLRKQSAPVGDETMLTGIYGKDGRLVYINMVQIEDKGGYYVFLQRLQLPQDVSGCMLKLFMWDMDNLKPLQYDFTEFIYERPTQARLAQDFAENQGARPRLLVSQSRMNQLKDQKETDVNLKNMYNKLKSGADSLIVNEDWYKVHVVKYMNSVITLSLLHQLTGEERYGKAIADSFEHYTESEWGTDFLTISYTTRALAIGYDWLYDYWSDTQKEKIKNAIMQKGLNRYVLAHAGELDYPYNTMWVHEGSNWNATCNAGILMGALAIYEEEQELTSSLIEKAIKSIEKSLRAFSQDGGWGEGIYYWNYTANSIAAFISSLETSFGTDYGLLKTTGMLESGYFPVYMSGIVHSFNFNDAEHRNEIKPELFWFAQKTKNPLLGRVRYNKIHSGMEVMAEDLLWYQEEFVNLTNSLPLDRKFARTESAGMRNSWVHDQNTIYLGIKGGHNNESHANLSIGTFVLDANGERWIQQLGIDSYSLPGYWEKGENGRRWTYYRSRAEGQNTCVVNPGLGPDQNPYAFGKMMRFISKSDEVMAQIDMTQAHNGYAEHSARGFLLRNNRTEVVIQDEIITKAPAEIYWFAHTDAQIAIAGDGKTATLTKKGKKMWVGLYSSVDASFEDMPASPLESSPKPEGQSKNAGIRKIAIHFESVEDVKFAVRFVPLKGEETKPATPYVPEDMADWDW